MDFFILWEYYNKYKLCNEDQISGQDLVDLLKEVPHNENICECFVVPIEFAL
ncbi:hypothetical protein SAMN02745131_01595 [Flavisolibacter ginsengisoli DSM 18119]|jgi:hypothetical protein|uniref:Uncharacterized protein n=1 Tax=Flavisolibacter ginsengisoli DSM 18119 TaxID=1121884 RepID=A0A1M4Y553_9BACT|nr:hypothetical protein SAMN02745131_01595 [Flavisolibacter ginsengisoli DSM 18119]